MLESKRGQITYFIIAGVVVVIAFAFVYYARNSLFAGFSSNPDVTSFQQYVDSCIDLVAKYGIYKMGTQGGWIDLPADSYNDTVFDIGYAYDNGNTFVSLDEMNSQLSSFVTSNLPVCIKNFSPFTAEGFQVQQGNISADVLFADRDVLVKVHYPVKIAKGKFSAELDDFSVDEPIAIKTIQYDVNAFVSDFSDRYDFSALRKENANYYIHSLGDTDLFIDENLDSRLSGENYLFMWVVR